jgi:hypothetical protein
LWIYVTCFCYVYPKTSKALMLSGLISIVIYFFILQMINPVLGCVFKSLSKRFNKR